MQSRQIRSTVEPPLAAIGLRVEDVSVSPAGRRSVVRITVDRDLAHLAGDATTPVAPLSLDDVAEATRAVSAALDADPSMGSAPYVLEVSSPGVDRPLTSHDHFRRNVGRLVTLALHDGGTVAGRIRAVTEAAIEVTPDAAATAATTGVVGMPDGPVPLSAVRLGRVVVEFGRVEDLDGDDLDNDDDLDDDDLDDDDLDDDDLDNDDLDNSDETEQDEED